MIRVGLRWAERPYVLSSLDSDAHLCRELEKFRPHGYWFRDGEVPLYRRCARALRGRAFRVVSDYNQWLRTPKQLLGWHPHASIFAPILTGLDSVSVLSLRNSALRLTVYLRDYCRQTLRLCCHDAPAEDQIRG